MYFTLELKPRPNQKAWDKKKVEEAIRTALHPLEKKGIIIDKIYIPPSSENTPTEKPPSSENASTEKPPSSKNTSTEKPPSSENTSTEKPLCITQAKITFIAPNVPEISIPLIIKEALKEYNDAPIKAGLEKLTREDIKKLASVGRENEAVAFWQPAETLQLIGKIEGLSSYAMAHSNNEPEGLDHGFL